MRAHLSGVARLSTPAKLNLSLRICGRRADGYHLLDSIVVPINLFDDLALRAAPAPTVRIGIECQPPGAAPADSQNLAYRAAALFLVRTGQSAAVDLTLHKRIPAGAGLGGGSSDAAAVLRALNALSPAPVPPATLAAWAIELGADVPFFLYGRPARMRGIGDQLEPIQVGLDGPIVVAFPGVGLDTGTVYRTYDGSLTTSGAASTIRPPTSGQEPLEQLLVNDLEAAAFHIQPAVMNLRRTLCALGARGVLMTGSGSAVFGVWRQWDEAQVAASRLRADGIWARVVETLQRNPAIEVTT